MDEGILSLKWNNHTSTFIHTLSKLNKAELYSDLTLACDGKFFPVHKLVLSVCSDYFEEILAKTKCQHPIIVLKDIRHSDLEALLTYMYAGEANVAQSELANLIKAAECLRIKGLAVPDEAPITRDKKRSLNYGRDEEKSCSKRRRNNSSSDNPKTDDDNLCQDRLQDRSSRNRNRSNNSEDSATCLRPQTRSSHVDEPSQKESEEVVIDLDPVEVDVKQEILTDPKLEPCDFNTNSSHELPYPHDDGDPLDEYDGESSQHDLDYTNDGTSGLQDQQQQLGSWDPNSSGIPPGYSLENFHPDDGSQMMNTVKAPSIPAIRPTTILPKEMMGQVFKKLEQISGVTTSSLNDLRIVDYSELTPVLKRIQDEKLITAWKFEHTDHSLFSTSNSPEKAATVTDNNTVECSPDITLESEDWSVCDWAAMYDIPWNRLSANIRAKLSASKSLSAIERRELVRLVADDIQTIHQKPGRKNLRTIASRMCDKYKILWENEGGTSGPFGLYKQLGFRIENVNRKRSAMRLKSATLPSRIIEIKTEQKSEVNAEPNTEIKTEHDDVEIKNEDSELECNSKDTFDEVNNHVDLVNDQDA